MKSIGRKIYQIPVTETFVNPEVERELNKFIRIQLPCGASATVSKDISKEGIAALEEMTKTAMRNVGSKKS